MSPVKAPQNVTNAKAVENQAMVCHVPGAAAKDLSERGENEKCQRKHQKVLIEKAGGYGPV